MVLRIRVKDKSSSDRKRRNTANRDAENIQEPLGPFEPNLTDDMTEEEKIKALASYSCYGSTHYQEVHRPLPDTYVCYRCGRGGHHIRDCPTNQDESFRPLKRIKRSSGIPRSFMVEVDDPTVMGAMVTTTGEFVLPAIHVEAYRCQKKERPPFLPQEPPTSGKEEEPIPEVVCCPLCRELLREAAIVPCCGNSFCDQCICDVLLDSEQPECPVCHSLVAPVAVVANVCVRKLVDSYMNGSGYFKRHTSLSEHGNRSSQRPT